MWDDFGCFLEVFCLGHQKVSHTRVNRHLSPTKTT